MAKEKESTKPKFTKQQILKAKAFENYVDLLNGVLDENKLYTKDEVNRIITAFYEVV